MVESRQVSVVEPGFTGCAIIDAPFRFSVCLPGVRSDDALKALAVEHASAHDVLIKRFIGRRE
jgi:hypothetical protein